MIDFLRSTESTVRHALHLNASDIHITPTPSGFLIRLRINGVLGEAIEVEPEPGRALIQAFKAEGKMNIAETRRPQDARLSKQGTEMRLAKGCTLETPRRASCSTKGLSR